MSPLTHTVRLIDGNQTHADPTQHTYDAVGRETFRREIEQLEPTSLNRGPNRIGFFLGIIGGERASLHTGFFQTAHLMRTDDPD